MASVKSFQKMKCILHAIRIAHAHSDLFIEADVVDGIKISEAVPTSMHVFERNKHLVNNLVDIFSGRDIDDAVVNAYNSLEIGATLWLGEN